MTSIKTTPSVFIALVLMITTVHVNCEIQILPRNPDNALELNLFYQGDFRIRGQLGMGMPSAVGNAVDINCAPEDGPLAQCKAYGDFAWGKVIENTTTGCTRVEWTSTQARKLEDCFNIPENVHMYGGSETLRQYWPINENKLEERPYVTADFLQINEFGDVLENYWLISTGVAIHVDENTPLFVSYDTVRQGQLCFVASDTYPYDRRETLTLGYDICVSDNIKSAHLSTFSKYFKKPSTLPDEIMLVRPLWSTWAQYKTSVNQSIVLDYAHQVIDRGFKLSSHIEIDDHWETCYGMEDFNRDKFPDPAAMVNEVKSLDLRVTLWVHPFVNFDCDLFQEGLSQGYFVKDQKGKTAITSWWQGSNSGLIDTNNPDAVQWWIERLEKLRTNYGIDSFKFDAGEVNWLPYSRALQGDVNLSPNIYTTKYVDAISYFGGLVEARTGHRNQEHAIFTRMLDKLSHWGYDAGLKSMIPTALYFGIVGYPFVLPDMIGGNAYGDWPTKELYIRWMQVNIFMPAVQFSIVPWDEHFDQETIDICLKVLEIRETHRETILEAARQSIIDGSPINRPLWWIDPTDPETFVQDQAYMLGDKILVAPVVIEGAVSRDIYLPVGQWRDGLTNQTHIGRIWLRDYPVPLDTVPYFIKL